MTSAPSTQTDQNDASPITNPSPSSDPYLPKNANEILKAEDWNKMQENIHKHINCAYAELQELQAKIDALKGDLNNLNNLLKQHDSTKLDNSLPLTLHRESTDTNGDVLTLVSYNDEAPYMNFCHLPGGGSTANATRYGYIQGGLNSDKKPVFLVTSDNSAELHIHGSKVFINDRDILAEIDSVKKIVNINNQSITCTTLECTDSITLGDFHFKWYPKGVNDDNQNSVNWQLQKFPNILIKMGQYHWGSLISPKNCDKLQIVRGMDAATLARGYAWCSDGAGWGKDD